MAGQDVSTTPGPFLLGLDEVGVPTWARSLETQGAAAITGIAVAPGPALVFVGTFEGEIVSGEHRLSSTGRDCMIGRVQLGESPGTLEWLHAIGGAGEQTCRSLALGSDGSSWVTGSYTESFGELPQPKGLADVMVLHVLPTGQLQSAFGFGSAGDDHGHHIAIYGEQGVMVSGNFGGKAEGAALELSEELRLVPVGDYDGYVAWFDTGGTPVGATAVSGPGFDVVSHAIPHAGGWLISGAQQQEADPAAPVQGFVARLEGDGAIAWTWSDPLMAAVTQVAVLRDRLAVLGHHRDGFEIGGARWRVVGDTGITLVLLDDAGTLTGGYGCDSPGNDRGIALATTPDGRIALVGNTSPGGGCVRLPGATAGGFVRLMVLDAQGELRPLVVEH